MSYLEHITEKETTGYSFQIKHKNLELPRDLYLNNLDHYEDPFSEEAAQHLIEEYLDWIDEQGLLGMVRLQDNPEENKVELDAAIRYLIPED
ncbi:hypothetical protein [Halanaerobaculum tunisiense]